MRRDLRSHGLAAAALGLALAAPADAIGHGVVTNDYPTAALREGREGTASFTVDVTEQGRAENCVITQSSGWADLDEATCNVVKLRARFRPKTDQDGKPIRGTFSSKVRWKLPQ